MYKIFTSESVAAGHPDKICDQVSDAIVDAALSADPTSKVAVETLVTTNLLVMAGEVTTKGVLDYEKIARGVIADLGYTDPKLGFSNTSTKIQIHVHQQSSEIASQVGDEAAGDQGMMFGFATSETDSLMPTPIAIAHALTAGLDQLRTAGKLPYLLPDGKSEVTVSYADIAKPTSVDRVVLAVAHQPSVELKQIKTDLYKLLVVPTLTKFKFKLTESDFVLNGAGQSWTTPGPASDTGVTGRKIVVDTYGGFARAGGGAFSGKDPSKVDRSAAYAARYIAKNLVSEALADQVEVQLAYVIGQPEPIATALETYGTEKKPLKVLEDFAWELLRPSVPNILQQLDLRKPIYRSTAAYGHFGRDNFSWEKIGQLVDFTKSR